MTLLSMGSMFTFALSAACVTGLCPESKQECDFLDSQVESIGEGVENSMRVHLLQTSTQHRTEKTTVVSALGKIHTTAWSDEAPHNVAYKQQEQIGEEYKQAYIDNIAVSLQFRPLESLNDGGNVQEEDNLQEEEDDDDDDEEEEGEESEGEGLSMHKAEEELSEYLAEQAESEHELDKEEDQQQQEEVVGDIQDDEEETKKPIQKFMSDSASGLANSTYGLEPSMNSTSSALPTILQRGYKAFRFTPLKFRDGPRLSSAVQIADIQFFRDGRELSCSACKAENPGGRNPRREKPTKAIDGNPNTKWYDAEKKALVITFPSPVQVDAYTFTTADDRIERDPIQWTLEATKDGVKWAVLHQQTTNFPTPTARLQTILPAFQLGYRYYRFKPTLLRNEPEKADMVKISEIVFKQDGEVIPMTGVKVTNRGGVWGKGDSPENAIDGHSFTVWSTKWTDNPKQRSLLVDFFAPVHADEFQFSTSRDKPECDPVEWKLQGSNDQDVWTTLHQNSDTDAMQKQWCSEEWHKCTCTGTAWYGRKYVSGKPGNGALNSFEQMEMNPHKMLPVEGTFKCNDAMFGDPMPLYKKGCWCLEKHHTPSARQKASPWFKLGWNGGETETDGEALTEATYVLMGKGEAVPDNQVEFFEEVPVTPGWPEHLDDCFAACKKTKGRCKAFEYCSSPPSCKLTDVAQSGVAPTAFKAKCNFYYEPPTPGMKKPLLPSKPTPSPTAPADARMLFDPMFVHVEQEGLHLKKKVENAGITVETFHLTNGFFPPERILIVPELEKQDLLDSMTYENRVDLKSYVLDGGRLIFSGDVQGFAVRVLNAVFGMELVLSHVHNQGTQGDRVELMESCEQFCGSGTTLKLKSNSALVQKSSLPKHATCIYALTNSADGCAVWMSLVGNGKIIYLGFDWKKKSKSWNNVLKAALAGVPPVVINPPQHSSTTNVALFYNAHYVDTAREANYVKRDLEAQGIRYRKFQQISGWDRSEGVIIIPELEREPLTLTGAAKASLKKYVEQGGTLVIAGHYQGRGLELLNQVFGWTLRSDMKSIGGSSDKVASECGVLCDGPDSLKHRNLVSYVLTNTAPQGTTHPYVVKDGKYSTVFITPSGIGRVVYLGFDWYDYNRGDWPKLLEMIVKSSPLGGIPVETPAPTMAPTPAPTLAPTPAPTSPTPAPTNHIYKGTPNFCVSAKNVDLPSTPIFVDTRLEQDCRQLCTANDMCSAYEFSLTPDDSFPCHHILSIEQAVGGAEGAQYKGTNCHVKTHATKMSTDDTEVATTYVFAHPSYVEPSFEITNLENNLISKGISFVNGVSVKRWHPDQVAMIIPEMEKHRVPFPPETASTLKDWVEAGGRLVVLGDVLGHGLDLLNLAFNWALRTTTKAIVGVHDQAYKCGIFCDGPHKLDMKNIVTLVELSSLPTGTRIGYWDGKDQVSVFSQNLKKGRVAYLGFDFFDANQGNWPAILDYALGDGAVDSTQRVHYCGFASSTVMEGGTYMGDEDGTLEECKSMCASFPECVGFKFNPYKALSIATDVHDCDFIMNAEVPGGWLYQAEPTETTTFYVNQRAKGCLVPEEMATTPPPTQEGRAAVAVFSNGKYTNQRRDAHLLGDIAATHSYKVFSDLTAADWSPAEKTLVVPRLARKGLALDSEVAGKLADWVYKGGRLVVTGSTKNILFINGIFGTKLDKGKWESSGFLQKDLADCGLFCTCSDKIAQVNAIRAVSTKSLPETATPIYINHAQDRAAVFQMNHGSGKIVYLGFNWYASNHPDWKQVLEKALL